MLDILSLIYGRKRKSPSGWHSFNAVCCHNRGHRQDTKQRGGLRYTDYDGWVYHCFNCNYKCSYKPGRHFDGNLKQLLGWLGKDRDEIERLSFQSFQQRSIIDVKSKIATPLVINFNTVELPDGAVPLDMDNPDHQPDVQYLRNRGIDPMGFPYYITPQETTRNRDRVIIPYFYRGVIVGYTSRFYDGRVPKYVSEQQRGYVFNIDNQHPDWRVCIVVEGQFDAISIGGCAYMGSNISDQQAQILNRLHRTIIVVPDRDRSGLALCDRALDLGYQVSIPDWSSEVKDVNDAVGRYGRLATTLSILESATNSRIKVDMLKRKIKL
jgi:hypothetical protein